MKSKKNSKKNVPAFSTTEFSTNEPILITNSLIKTFQDCRRMFLFKYIYRFSPLITPKPFIFGTHFGLGLDSFYSTGKIDTDDILNKYFDELEKFSAHLVGDDFDEYRKQAFILEGILSAYQKKYQKDLKDYKYVGHEVEFKFPVKVSDTIFKYNYGGKIDLVLQSRGKSKENVIFEHKTASNINRGYILKLALDTQVTGYLIGGDVLDLNVKRVVYNINGKSKLRLSKKESESDFRRRIIEEYETNPQEYFVRQELSRSGAHLTDFLSQLSEKIIDIDMIIQRVHNKDPKLMDLCYRSENHCVTPWGTCPFIKVCGGKNGMDEDELNADFTQRETLHAEISKETQS